MKLDRNLTENDGKGKYAVVKLREVTHRHPHYQAIQQALLVLDNAGVLNWGLAETEDEFFLIMLKDLYSANALRAYSDTARNDGELEFAEEIRVLADRSGRQSRWCKRPD